MRHSGPWDWSARSGRPGVLIGAVPTDISAAPTTATQESLRHHNESGFGIDVGVLTSFLSGRVGLANAFVHQSR
jgi:hypothetical protein